MVVRKPAKTFLVLSKTTLSCSILIQDKLRRILDEDLWHDDITSEALIDPRTRLEGKIICKEDCIVAGIQEASTLFEMHDCHVESIVKEGKMVKGNSEILKMRGRAITILGLERPALNLMTRMSGIATETNRILKEARTISPSVRIAGTRKTAPGLTFFDKRAISVGGGDTHRIGLDDSVLIKDNHIAIVGSVSEAVKKAKDKISFTKKIEVEVSTLNDAVDAVKAGADIILLDNLTPTQIQDIIKNLKRRKYRDRILIEASGGINQKNIRAYASTGVDVISLGFLTHSVKSIDMSLEVTSSSG